MPDGQVLEFTHVTKRFNDLTAVSDLSARVEPGVVTAFLGPNGAGKTTTLRILLGQVRATTGTATIGGVAYPDLRHPLRTIGSVLEETVYRPRRTASRQLTIAAKANGIPLSRVDEVLSLVGLANEGEGRIGSFSLGMRQRLSVAHALLGDPGALVFDEPANGLDPEGIRWMRLLMRRLADEGRTVLVSSHVLSEVEQVADNVLVLSKGQLVLSSDIEKLADPAAGSVVVDADDRAALKTALAAGGFEVEVLRSGLTVRGGDAATVGAIAASAGVALSTLVQRGPTLEDVFIELVRGGKLEPRAEAAASQLTPGASADAAQNPTIQAEEPVAEESDDESVDAQDATEITRDAAVSGDASEQSIDGEAAAAVPVAEADVDASQTVSPTYAVDDAADAAADAADAVDDLEHAEAELRYAAAASDANDAEDAADLVSAAAETHRDDADATPPPSSDEAPARSFDEILFGAPAVDSAAAPLDGDSADQDAAAHEGSVEADSEGEPEAAHEGDEPSGVEFFAELNDSAESAPESASAEEDEPAQDEQGAASDEDPRSAAVSSMLAAAARAYYEDEPKDYPLGDSSHDEGSHDDSSHGDSSHDAGSHDEGDASSADGDGPSDEADAPDVADDGEHEPHDEHGPHHHGS